MDDEHPYKHLARCRTCQTGWLVVLGIVALVVLSSYIVLSTT